MKKAAAAIILSAFAVSASGCVKSSESAETSAKVYISETSAAEKSSDTQITIEKPKQNPAINTADTDTALYSEETTESDSPETIPEYENSDITEQNDQESYITPIAEELYHSGLKIYFELFCGCPYDLHYSNGTTDGYYPISNPEITSVSDIYSYYKTAFYDSSELESSAKYKDIDGKAYCRDSARGADSFYQGTDLIYVDGNETEVIFSAVSHYENTETGEQKNDITNRFVISMQDGNWKISEFHLPK